MSLHGRIAVVTGAGQGIGKAIAEELAGRGAHVVVSDLNLAAASAVADAIERSGRAATPLALDVTDQRSVSDAFDHVAETIAPVDILVNNAGVSIDAGLRKLTLQQWDTTVAVSMTGTMLCSQAAVRQMTDPSHSHRAGSIVNISSRAWLGWWGQTAYAAAKGGVVSATRAMAIELASRHIRVNCIAPGLIDTPLLRAEPEHVMSRLLRAQPMGTIGTPEDVAWAAAYLAGPASGAVTGQVLYVCGGKSLYAQPVR